MTITRAEARDRIRRRLQLIPPIDSGTGVAGAVPAYSPEPSNQKLNQALREALSILSRETGFHTEVVTLNVPATGLDGSQKISLQAATGRINSINEIRRVYWQEASTDTAQILKMRSYQELDRNGWTYDQEPAGTPRICWVEGYSIWLQPGCQNGGTLTIHAGSGPSGWITDTDVIDQLPTDYLDIVIYQATVLVCGMMPTDAEKQEIAQALAPLATQGFDAIKKLRMRLQSTAQTTLALRTYRRRSSRG